MLKRSINLEIIYSSHKSLNEVLNALGRVLQGEVQVVSSRYDFSIMKILRLFGAQISSKKLSLANLGRLILWLIRLVRLNGVFETSIKTIISKRIVLRVTQFSEDNFVSTSDDHFGRGPSVSDLILFLDKESHYGFMDLTYLNYNKIKLLKDLKSVDVILHSLHIKNESEVSPPMFEDLPMLYGMDQKHEDINNGKFFRFIKVEDCFITQDFIIKNQMRSRLEDFCTGTIFGYQRYTHSLTSKGSSNEIGFYIPFTESYFHRFNNAFLSIFEIGASEQNLPIYFSWQWFDFKELITSIFPDRKLVWLNRGEVYYFDSLLIPCYTGLPESSDWKDVGHLNPNFLTLSKSCTPYVNSLNRNALEKKMVFVDRTKDSLRPLVNVNYLKRVLKSFGVYPILPGSMEHNKQISVFNEAKIVVATSGAALTNLIFCEPGTTLIHIYGSDEFSTTWELLCRDLDIQYRKISTKRVYGIGYLIDRGASRISRNNVRKIRMYIHSL